MLFTIRGKSPTSDEYTEYTNVRLENLGEIFSAMVTFVVSHGGYGANAWKWTVEMWEEELHPQTTWTTTEKEALITLANSMLSVLQGK